MSLNQVDCSTRISPAGAPGLHVEASRTTATLGSVGVVPPSRSATYSMPFAMSLPYGSFSTSGGVRLAAIGRVLHADPARGVDRSVVVDERHPRVVGLDVLGHAAVRHDDQLRAASYEQLSAE